MRLSISRPSCRSLLGKTETQSGQTGQAPSEQSAARSIRTEQATYRTAGADHVRAGRRRDSRPGRKGCFAADVIEGFRAGGTGEFQPDAGPDGERRRRPATNGEATAGQSQAEKKTEDAGVKPDSQLQDLVMGVLALVMLKDAGAGGQAAAAGAASPDDGKEKASGRRIARQRSSRRRCRHSRRAPGVILRQRPIEQRVADRRSGPPRLPGCPAFFGP